jgi:hypothetical protein
MGTRASLQALIAMASVAAACAPKSATTLPSEPEQNFDFVG